MFKNPGSQIFGLTNSGYTVDKDGELGLYKNGISLNKRNFSVDRLIDNVLNKKEQFSPKKIEDIDKYAKPEKEKEPPEPEFVIKKY